MTELRIPETTEPTYTLPVFIEALRDCALTHQERSEDCGDHRVETCLCGANTVGSERMPQETFDAGPDARRAWREERLSASHRWDYLDHFREEWNKVVDAYEVKA